jgi:hypothetical protein
VVAAVAQEQQVDPPVGGVRQQPVKERPREHVEGGGD